MTRARYRDPRSARARALDLLLGRNRSSPLFRFAAVTAGFMLLLGAALALEYQTLTPASLLRHWFLPTVVVVAVLYAGARRLNDLFNLEDSPGSTFRTMEYLWGAIFGLAYDEIEIKDGALTAESKKGRVSAIGGPGLLKIHLGNAALFELVNNASIIYAAKKDQFLHGFERLREEVIDLRDQIRDLGDLPLYTKDGIPVTAVQAQVAFRVYSQQKRTERNPYPYDPLSVRRLIYGQLAGPGYVTRPWTDVVADLARAEVGRYIGQHQFRELVAQKQKGMLPPPPSSVGDTTSVVQSSPPTSRAAATANPRRELTLSFYTAAFARRCRELGVELIWIGVGTLQTPPDISQELIETWQKEFAELTRLGATTLEHEARAVRRKAWWEFCNHVKEYWYARTRTTTTEPQKPQLLPRSEWPLPFNLVSLYAIKLREIRRASKAPIEPELDAALEYLDRMGGPNTLGGTANEPEPPAEPPHSATQPDLSGSDLPPASQPGPESDWTQSFGPWPPAPR